MWARRGVGDGAETRARDHRRCSFVVDTGRRPPDHTPDLLAKVPERVCGRRRSTRRRDPRRGRGRRDHQPARLTSSAQLRLTNVNGHRSHRLRHQHLRELPSTARRPGAAPPQTARVEDRIRVAKDTDRRNLPSKASIRTGSGAPSLPSPPLELVAWMQTPPSGRRSPPLGTQALTPAVAELSDRLVRQTQAKNQVRALASPSITDHGMSQVCRWADALGSPCGAVVGRPTHLKDFAGDNVCGSWSPVEGSGRACCAVPGQGRAIPNPRASRAYPDPRAALRAGPPCA